MSVFTRFLRPAPSALVFFKGPFLETRKAGNKGRADAELNTSIRKVRHRKESYSDKPKGK